MFEKGKKKNTKNENKYTFFYNQLISYCRHKLVGVTWIFSLKVA